eukprot:gene917-1158_t
MASKINSSSSPQQQQQQQNNENKEQIKKKKKLIAPRNLKELTLVVINYIKKRKFSIAFWLIVLSSILYGYDDTDTYLGYWLNVTVRFSRSMATALQLMINYKILSFTDESDPSYPEKQAACHQDSADKILKLCLANRGLYIKAGQYIASLNHILPIQYTRTLAVLQDQAPWRPYYDIEKVFLKDLGHLPAEYFSDFEKIPIAAASLAQVHRAFTKEGDEVAVKVQYPDLQANFNGDIFTHSVLLSLCNLAFPDFEFNWMAEEMKNVLIKEMDFLQEADNSERTKKELQNNIYAYIPKVYRELSSSRILTTEFIHGTKINNLKKLREMGLSEKTVIQRFIEICSEQIFIHGFTHSDPHPGNVLVRNHPLDKRQPQIVLLDHGLYRELDEEFRINFCQLYKNLVLCNTEKVQYYSKALGVENYKLFSSIILMRNFEGASVGLSNSIPVEELERMINSAMEKMKEINLLMKTMPRHLLLVLRNNNLLRSINMELGSPVNRFSIMARVATRGLNSRIDPNRNKLLRLFSRIQEKITLEILLKGHEFVNWFLAETILILVKLGIIDPKKTIKKAMAKLG